MAAKVEQNQLLLRVRTPKLEKDYLYFGKNWEINEILTTDKDTLGLRDQAILELHRTQVATSIWPLAFPNWWDLVSLTNIDLGVQYVSLPTKAIKNVSYR